MPNIDETEDSLNLPGEEATLNSPAELDRAIDEAEAKSKVQETKAQEAAEEESSKEVEEASEITPSSEESVEEIKAQRDGMYKRLKTLEQKIKTVKPVVSKGGEDEWKAKVEFLLENRDVTEEEFEHLATVALRQSGSVNTGSLKDAKKAESDYLTYRRKKEELKRKIPGSTPSSPLAKLQKSSEEIANMSKEEHMKYEQELLKEESRGV